MFTKIIIVDSDGLIALFNTNDAHAEKAKQLFEMFHKENARLIYPVTTLVETIDTLQRKLKQYQAATEIVQLILQAQFATESIEPINGAILQEAATFFKKAKAKKRITLADAIVAATAKKYKATAIFSFDKWYQKQGFTLVGDLMK